MAEGKHAGGGIAAQVRAQETPRRRRTNRTDGLTREHQTNAQAFALSRRLQGSAQTADLSLVDVRRP